MRPYHPQVSHISKILSRLAPSQLQSFPRTTVKMTTSASSPSIENTDIKHASNVNLTTDQKTLVGSVLDLFSGHPSKSKLVLWKDDATFEDPLTVAKGREKFEAQWYGLSAAFSEITPLGHQVTDAGNPILLDLKTRYKVKGIGKETTIESVVAIHTSPDGKISKVEDRWNGSLPDSSIANVSSVSQLLSPVWWVNYWIAWGFWVWSFFWYTRIWRVGGVNAFLREMC